MKLKPGLANLYAIWQGKGLCLFYNSCDLHVWKKYFIQK